MTRLLSLSIVVVLLLPTPLLVTGTYGRTSGTIVQIDSSLTEHLENISLDERVPVVIKLQDRLNAVQRNTIVKRLIQSSIEIRHVFTLIPMISAFIDASSIEQVSSIAGVEAIGFDSQMQALSFHGERTTAPPQFMTDYSHPHEIMSADILWDQGFDGEGVVVAVLDSGAEGDHPDLVGQLIGFKDFINNQDDLNPSDGIDAYDDNGHGTAVAGFVAGTGAASAGLLMGVAPGAELLIVKVLDDDGAGEDSQIAQGIEFAVDRDVDIISLSLGGRYDDSLPYTDPTIAAVQAAINAGITVIIAAGNEGPAAETINSPAVVDEAITVGSSSGTAGIVAFSSRGPVRRIRTQPTGLYSKPDVVAPGNLVVSARASSASAFEYPVYNSSQFSSRYTVWSGTSASTPQVSGLAALLIDKHSDLTPIKLKTALMLSGTDLDEDSMAQGWGLPNVTLASEIIDNTGGDLTLLTPQRFPALPGSPNAFIFGDERDPQNITIISTVDQGVVTIELTGNASQFIIFTKTSIDVEIGYSYFGVSLSIPENLELNAVGQYTGELQVKSGSTIVASQTLEFSITQYGGSLLVDMSHHSAEDPDDPSFYRYFNQYLRDQGIVIDELGTPQFPRSIDQAELSASEAFMIMDTEEDYSQSEVEAIHDYVEDGGVLLVLSEFYDNITDTTSFGIDSYNEILAPFGIQSERFEIGRGVDADSGLIYGADYGGTVENHPLMEGVDNLYVISGSTLHVDPAVSGAQGLFWYDSSKTHAIVAIANYGLGQVIAVSDGSTLYDDILFDAIEGGADNLRLIKNIAQQLITQSPRIFDVVMEEDTLTDDVTFTAYVFDNDLAEVNYSVFYGNEVPITGTTSSELGYKYMFNFTAENTGFYSVHVTATDLAGREKSVLRSFVVGATILDPNIYIIVIASLGGIIGIAIIYILWRKYGPGKRVRRRFEREWEPQWESDGEPPAIQ